MTELWPAATGTTCMHHGAQLLKFVTVTELWPAAFVTSCILHLQNVHSCWSDDDD